jgi:hypothetical protein
MKINWDIYSDWNTDVFHLFLYRKQIIHKKIVAIFLFYPVISRL